MLLMQQDGIPLDLLLILPLIPLLLIPLFPLLTSA
jgi:hypothetical protein